jgi:long-chain acyl-CoA synthetase
LKRLTDYLQPGTAYFRNRAFGPSEVMAGIETMAYYLEHNLVSSSPFIYLFASNHIKTALAFFGIIKAHRICVVVDPEIGRLELHEMMQDTPPAACVKIDETAITWDFNKEIEITKTVWIDDGSEDLIDVCMMIYTAADEGYAKAAMLTHNNIVQDALSAIDVSDIITDSVTFAVLPFNHLYGLQVGLIMPNLVGAKYVIEEKSKLTNTQILFDKILLYQVTHLFAIPVLYYLFSKYSNGILKMKNVKRVISGGYKLSELVSERFIKIYQLPICEGYGLTEAGPSCTLNSIKYGYKIKSIGKSLPCCQVKIDEMTESDYEPWLTGEILVKGSNVMKGYYKKPHETAAILHNGWLSSGDIGIRDSEGFIYFIRTKKNMINYGGQKIYPIETERLMLKNRNIRYVKINGVENILLGQTTHAEITLINDSLKNRHALQKWLKENITWYKVPKKITIIK